QERLHEAAAARQAQRTAVVDSVAEAVEATASGWARLPWSAVGPDGEAKLNEQGVSVRCLTRPDGAVPDSEEEPGLLAHVARAY
ncbi:MAG: proline--tRNA ligase, partial [Carbonactinosporaceae bacterium]